MAISYAGHPASSVWAYSMKSIFIVGVAFVGATLFASPARACSGGQAPPAFAMPRPGTANVSTATSLIVFSSPKPSQVELTAGGQMVTVGEVEELGFSVASSFGATKVWRVKVPDFLAPSTEHVLRVVDTIDAGVTGQVELTRFTTANGYDKQLGTPPKVRSLELWRVRYPLSEINSGNCVFAEYRGYIRIDYDPATIPNTTPDGTIYSISIGPKNGGSTQAFYFPGDDLFKGVSPEQDPHALDRWAPELDPSREYCATITAFGDGDLARLPSMSESFCASVKQLSSFVDGSSSNDAGPPLLAIDGPPANGCSCTTLGNRASKAQWLSLVAAVCFGFLFRRSKLLHRAR